MLSRSSSIWPGLKWGPATIAQTSPVGALVAADRMARLLDILIHAGKVGADPRGDHRLRHRLVLGIVKADLAERQMRRHHDVPRPDRAAVGDHSIRLVIDRAAVLEDVAAVAGDGAGEPAT